MRGCSAVRCHPPTHGIHKQQQLHFKVFSCNSHIQCFCACVVLLVSLSHYPIAKVLSVVTGQAPIPLGSGTITQYASMCAILYKGYNLDDSHPHLLWISKSPKSADSDECCMNGFAVKAATPRIKTSKRCDRPLNSKLQASVIQPRTGYTSRILQLAPASQPLQNCTNTVWRQPLEIR